MSHPVATNNLLNQTLRMCEKHPHLRWSGCWAWTGCWGMDWLLGMDRLLGIQMAYLAQMMLDRGCTIAVNMDGGQSAAVAFMGHQLNVVWSQQPNGREQAEILAFGTSEQVGSFEMLDQFQTKKK